MCFFSSLFSSKFPSGINKTFTYISGSICYNALFISIVQPISYLLICNVTRSLSIIWSECVILSLTDLLEIICCPLILYEAVNEADI